MPTQCLKSWWLDSLDQCLSTHRAGLCTGLAQTAKQHAPEVSSSRSARRRMQRNRAAYHAGLAGAAGLAAGAAAVACIDSSKHGAAVLGAASSDQFRIELHAVCPHAAIRFVHGVDVALACSHEVALGSGGEVGAACSLLSGATQNWKGIVQDPILGKASIHTEDISSLSCLVDSLSEALQSSSRATGQQIRETGEASALQMQGSVAAIKDLACTVQSSSEVVAALAHKSSFAVWDAAGFAQHNSLVAQSLAFSIQSLAMTTSEIAQSMWWLRESPNHAYSGSPLDKIAEQTFAPKSSDVPGPVLHKLPLA